VQRTGRQHALSLCQTAVCSSMSICFHLYRRSLAIFGATSFFHSRKIRHLVDE